MRYRVEDWFSLTRREVVVGIASVGLSYVATTGDSHAQAPYPEANLSLFLKLSCALTGYQTLPDDLVRAFYDEISSRIPNIEQSLKELDGALANGKLTDQSSANTRANVTLITKAWFMGIVGEGKSAKVISYERALNYAAVADVVVLPTYARGEPHYWAKPPMISDISKH